jgi:hypothetical protein
VTDAAATGVAAGSATRRRRLVLLARTVLVMLLVAAAVLAGLGVIVQLRADPPETDGWLRVMFGRVFSVMAFGLAAVIGIPSAIGLWSMAGAREPDAVPALSGTASRAVAGVAIATVVVTAVVLVVTGSAATILNLGLLGIVALASLGLGGAAVFSPHRGRAIVSAVALALVVIGTAWVLWNAFLVR